MRILYNKLTFLSLALILTGCASTKTYPYANLHNEMKKHGSIWVEHKENGKVYDIEVKRSRIDKLTAAQTETINDYFVSLQPEFNSINEFIFVHYYPGKDNCNSTGVATRNSLGRQNKFFNNKMSKKENVSSLFVYKDDEGISRYDKNRYWQKDSSGLIEDLFFNYHFPCSSYLIFHQSGKYYVYFGESWMKKQLSDVDLFQALIRKNQ